MTSEIGTDKEVSVLICGVVSGSPDLRSCKLSHVVSSAGCLIFVSFLQEKRLSNRAESSRSGLSQSLLGSFVTVTRGGTTLCSSVIVGRLFGDPTTSVLPLVLW